MARLPRLFVPGFPQLIVQRGDAGALIAPDAEARDTLQGFIADAVREYAVALHAFALLPDQFFLLASATEARSLARCLQSVGRRYVQFFNRRNRREGNLWQGRYRSCIVQGERYLLPCTHYIELSPRRAGLVAEALDYPWSSFRHHVGVEALAFITEHAAHWALGNTPFERQNAYRAEAQESLDTVTLDAISAAAQGGWGLGDASFLEQITRLAKRRAQPLPRGRPTNLQRRATPAD